MHPPQAERACSFIAPIQYFDNPPSAILFSSLENGISIHKNKCIPDNNFLGSSLHDLDLLIRQPIQLIHQHVNLPVGRFDLPPQRLLFLRCSRIPVI